MTNQMVSRFRVKKLSPKHPLPIYKEKELPDINDIANIQRSVAQIETGVEKEEEEEHDLQAAISAAQAAVTTGSKVEKYIPTPDASHWVPKEEYESLYKKKYKEPSTLIRFSTTVEDCSGCPYLMDEEDEAYLSNINSLSEDEFEKMMWEFETITDTHWPHIYLDPTQLPDYNTFMKHVPDYSQLKTLPNVSTVYQHWLNRRQKRLGKTIVPHLKSEEAQKDEVDPYVCFRRRETKPVRKTRRTDQQSLERLRKLRSEMETARNLLEMVLRREKIRKEGIVLEHTVFDKKCKLREYQRTLGIKEDDDLIFMSKKKRKISAEGSGATIKITLNKLKRDLEKSPIQQAIENELSRKRELDAPYEDITEAPYQPFPLSTPKQFYQSLSTPSAPSSPPSSTQRHFRKRVGRGGRIFIDRIGFSHRESGPSSMDEDAYDRFQFDSDNSDIESDDMEVDEMNSPLLKHRAQLLSEVELRHLVTIPFVTPLNMMNLQNRAAASSHPNPSSSSSTTTTPTMPMRSAQPPPPSQPQIPQHQPRPQSQTPPQQQQNGNAHSPTIDNQIRRQNSRSRMTPQQQAVAMTNGMIAAAVNGVSNSNPTMQMAMPVTQQQQQQQQQYHQQQLTGTPTQKHNNPPLSLHF